MTTKKKAPHPGGRPRLGAEPRTTRTLSLAPDTVAWLIARTKPEGVSPGIIVDGLVLAEQKRERQRKARIT